MGAETPVQERRAAQAGCSSAARRGLDEGVLSRQMADLPQLRAADSDRDRTAGELREHYAAGRLDANELSERLEAVYAAITVAELDRQRADLPDPRPLPVPASARELARPRIYQDAGAVLIFDAGCVAVWAATGASGSFWPVWVILVSALRLARDGWRLLGPGADPEAHSRSRRRERRRQRRSLW
jgi:hypothetical protein